MKTVNQKLNEVLDVEESEETTEIVPYQPAEVATSGNPDKDMQDDFSVVRNTLHSLIDKGNELVADANFFAKEKQEARAVEAAAAAQKEARENALALLNLHKTRKDIERISATSPGGGGDTNITQNAVFIGTTGDLLKFTKEMNADGALKQALSVIDVTPDALNSPGEPKKIDGPKK